MQFYPHNISVALVGTSVSSSLAVTSSLINNFSAIPVNRPNTASIGLNITGARGADGTGAVVYGPTGAVGARGATGPRGDNILLLSSSWSGSACGGAPGSCVLSTLYQTIGLDNCGSFSSPSTFYTSYPSGLGGVTDTSADGYILYQDVSCTTLATGIGQHNGSRIFYTDGSGVISSVGCGA